MMGILEILYGIIVLTFALYYYYTLKFDFWRKRGIPGPKPIIYFGTAKDIILQKKLPLEYYKEIYDAYKDASLVGLFIKTIPILMIKDPALIKDVLITDAMIFTGRGVPYCKKAGPLMNTLFYIQGEEALYLRSKISPLFTPSKLKAMLPLLTQRSEVFKDWLDNLLLQSEEINCSELTERLTADFSGVCLLNYDVKTFRNERIEIFKYVKKFNKGDSWKFIIKQLLPDKAVHNKLSDLIGYYLFNNTELMQFCILFAIDIMNYRREHNIFKYDIVNILKEYKQNRKSTEKDDCLKFIFRYYTDHFTDYEAFENKFKTILNIKTNYEYQSKSNNK